MRDLVGEVASDVRGSAGVLGRKPLVLLETLRGSPVPPLGLREFAGLIVTRRRLADRDEVTITTDEFVAEVNEYADVIEDRVRTYLRSRHPSGVALTFTSKGADSLRKFASEFEYMHPGEVFSPIQLEEIVQREAKNLGDR